MPAISGRKQRVPRQAAADDGDERDDKRLDVTKAFVLQKQHHQHIERGDADPGSNGMPKSRFSAMAEPITSARSQAAMASSQMNPETNETGRLIMIAAGLRQIAAGDDPELEQSAWSRIAIKLEIMMTLSSV